MDSEIKWCCNSRIVLYIHVWIQFYSNRNYCCLYSEILKWRTIGHAYVLTRLSPQTDILGLFLCTFVTPQWSYVRTDGHMEGHTDWCKTWWPLACCHRDINMFENIIKNLIEMGQVHRKPLNPMFVFGRKWITKITIPFFINEDESWQLQSTCGDKFYICCVILITIRRHYCINWFTHVRSQFRNIRS